MLSSPLSHSRNSACLITPRRHTKQPYGAARSLIDLFRLCLLTKSISFTPQYQRESNRFNGYEDCLTCSDSGGEHTHIILSNYLDSLELALLGLFFFLFSIVDFDINGAILLTLRQWLKANQEMFIVCYDRVSVKNWTRSFNPYVSRKKGNWV